MLLNIGFNFKFVKLRIEFFVRIVSLLIWISFVTHPLPAGQMLLSR